MVVQLDDDAATRLREEGYVLVPGLFSLQEIEQFGAVCRTHFQHAGVPSGLGQTQPNAAIHVDGLTSLFSSPKVVGVFRALCGDDRLAFTGHCDIHKNMLSGWHKDSGESYGGYFRGDYFDADECRVYKIAVYLQDHIDDANGLTVRPGSHRKSGTTSGTPIDLKMHAGDAIVFDVRLTHQG